MEAVRQEVSRTQFELGDVTDSAQEILEENGKREEAALLSLAGSARELWNRSKALTLSAFAVMVILLAIELFVPGVHTWIAAAATAVAGLLVVVCWPLRLVLQARERAERRADDLRRRRESELAAKVQALRQDERDAINRREEAQRSVEDAEVEIEEIKDGRRLYRFIEERARNEAYGQYLGAISIVRQDFERLAELIEQHDASDRNGRPQLERIVLYIDDLDRCPASRVVEVLEAVHLLLASELFVVVVAVDPRWLVRSLEHRYAAEMPEIKSNPGPATPQDYLEKIFQIPFSLSPMSGDGYRRLIANLVTTEEIGHEKTAVVNTSVNRRTTLPAPSEDAGRPALALEPAPTPADSATQHNIDLNPAGLKVTRRELEYLGRLDSMMTTPRAAKRLTNLYRLVRVSLSRSQLALLLGSTGGRAEFPCVQLLLAISVGFPSIAPRLFDELTEQDRGDWWRLVESREPPASETRAWKRLVVAMNSLRTNEFPPDLAVIARWVPLVSQYSYGLRPPEPE